MIRRAASFSREVGTWLTNGSRSRQSMNCRCSVSWPRNRRGEEPPQAGSEARIDPGNPPAAVIVADQLDLSGLDETGGVDIDDAAIEDVRAEQHLARAALERRHIELRGRDRHRIRAELLDLVDRHEQLTAADRAPSGR